MMKLEDIEWCPTPLVKPIKNPDMEKEIKEISGMVPFAASYLYSVPWMAQTLAILQKRELRFISDKLSELIGLVVSMDNSCRYCYGANRAFLKLSGMKEREIRQLEEDINKTNLSEKEKYVLTFAQKISRSDPRPSYQDFKHLERIGFSKNEIIEIVYETTKSLFINRVTTMLALPPDPFESLMSNRWVQLLRPVLSLGMRMFMNRRKSSIPSWTNEGPGKEIVELLRELPAGYRMRSILDSSWNSMILSKRSKALISYIIAQTLSCEFCGSESVRYLRFEDFSDEDLSKLSKYLTCDRLMETEVVLIDFARDTVRYKPVYIQNKARGLTEHFSNEEVLEICGCAALANWMARLTILSQYIAGSE